MPLRRKVRGAPYRLQLYTDIMAAPPKPTNRPPSRPARLTTLLGKRAAGRPPHREFGFPENVDVPLFLWTEDGPLKEHPDYRAAKAGDTDAAIRLVAAVGTPIARQIKEKQEAGAWPANCIFVAPHAREALGDNAIPQTFAVLLSLTTGGQLDLEIIQTAKVYHTGADAMERMIARPSFSGQVVRDGRYVLVDDVSTMGGTLCDLADHIRRGGGTVVGVVVLVNASRSGRLFPAKKTVSRLEKEYGNDIREIFGIEPAALTADEAQYLVGFKTADEIRGRCAKARETTDQRLRSRGILGDELEVGKRTQIIASSARDAAFRSRRWIGGRNTKKDRN
ncbi:phosphoribosyl transferase domain protein [Burkholderia pseudomallei MSHR303]|nr:phosphoribosyl transferase domain protein [Burkholderia pseudomallei MSHR305]AHK66600.1 phosphoribosyl transferase domain protein [Burkholderia pseudomallei MSHR520]AIP79819.1 phosphoribosyl transferase domain protein [Burkholderia pseudomallei]KGW54675.1 phosphoribosyl transferase domain protein [Burkholderia pseudomallei MSHR303]